jgi:hypothetical protein
MINRFLALLTTVLPFSNALPSPESLHLTSDLGVQNVSDGFLVDQDGTKYELSTLLPFDELLSPSSFIAFEDGTKELDHRTGEVFSMPIHRGVFDDGTILQVQKDDSGNIIYAEIRHARGRSDTYFVKTQGCDDEELLAFSEDQMTESVLNEGFYLKDEEVIDNQVRRRETAIARNEAKLPDFVYDRGDGTSTDCPYFKVVKVGIVYDSEFCTKYGGKNEARSRIMMVVAATSVLYEQDMCVMLQLTDIYTPDSDCSATSTFASFRRDNACGSGNSETFIRYFRDWMNANRDQIGLDPDATFHAFTGYPHRGTLGCGYIGTVCQNPEFAYGVDYMTSESLSTQSIIFAHEFGHNLSARHLSGADAAGFRYIMSPSLKNPHDGFSQITIEKIIGYLDSNEVTCDAISFREPTSLPTEHPTNEPSDKPSYHPSTLPSGQPSPSPSELPTMHPNSTPSSPPSNLPSEASSLSPTFIREVPPPPAQCSIEKAPRPPICILESQEVRYGCYEAIQLMSVQPEPWCSLEQPFFATVMVVGCEEQLQASEISNDEGRMLRKKKNQGKGKDKEEFDEVDGDGERAGGGGVIDLQTKVAVGSNDEGLDSFSAQDCTVGCTMLGDHICFLSSLGSDETKVYVLTFSVIHEGGVQLFTVDVTIQKDDTAISDCDVALTVCAES